MKTINQLTKHDVAAALGIYECSAEELLDGTISIKMREVEEIAEYIGVTVDEIINANQKLKVKRRK